MRLGVISDIHWSTDPDARGEWHGPYDFAALPERLDQARAAFRRERVDAVVVVGDLANAGDVASAKAVLDGLSSGSAARCSSSRATTTATSATTCSRASATR